MSATGWVETKMPGALPRRYSEDGGVNPPLQDFADQHPHAKNDAWGTLSWVEVENSHLKTAEGPDAGGPAPALQRKGWQRWRDKPAATRAGRAVREWRGAMRTFNREQDFSRKQNFSGKRNFRGRVLRWFERRKRDLPWRRTRDPYRIWISEVMLQQTRVAAVLPYYQRFIRRFPTVRALAGARTEEVLRYWSGLGYYSRARNLQRAAKGIVARHNEQFPRTQKEALELPGVGRYTAAAVLSMAYGEPLAVLDGNVARVLARLDGVRGDLRGTGRWQKLQARAQELMDGKFQRRGRKGNAEKKKVKEKTARLRQGFGGFAGEWNQAMMELGATVCTPRSPQCGACPVAKWCTAYRLGLVEEIPAKRRKRAPVRVKVAAAILLDPRGRTLLVRQNDGLDEALFSGLWQFPALAVNANGLRRFLGGFRKRFGWNGKDRSDFKALAGVRHSVTFREVTLLPVLVRVGRLPRVPQSRAVALAGVDRLPISNATRKIARAALENCKSEEDDAEAQRNAESER